MKYKDFETLKSNEDFKRVYTKRKSYANRELIMYIAKNGTDTKKTRCICEQEGRE